MGSKSWPMGPGTWGGAAGSYFEKYLCKSLILSDRVFKLYEGLC